MDNFPSLSNKSDTKKKEKKLCLITNLSDYMK